MKKRLVFEFMSLSATYRIAGKFGEDFNLAIWGIVKNRQIKFSPMKKPDIMHTTHARIYYDTRTSEAVLLSWRCTSISREYLDVW